MRNPLDSLSIVAKLRIVVLLGLVFFVGSSALITWFSYLESHEFRRAAVRQTVETAQGVLEWAHAQETSGKLSRDDAQTLAKGVLAKSRYSQSEYFWINDFEPRMVMHPIKPELDGKDLAGMKDPDGTALFVNFVDVVKKSGAGFSAYRWPKPGEEQPVEKISYVKGFAPWGWIVGSGVYVDDLRAAFLAKIRGLVVVVVIAAILNLLLARVVYLPIVAGIRRAVGVATEIAKGDVSQRVPRQTADEIGDLLAAMDTMSVNLNRAMKDVRQTAEELASASREIADGSLELSSRTEQASANLQETASNMAQVADAMKTASQAAHEAELHVTEATAFASEESAVFGEVVNKMDEIRRDSARIAEITGIIDGIAFQTNILALNAAVEAARAGEQGRGFAVVAGEVRILAQRSAQAAREIKDLITGSVQKIESGAKLTTAAGQTLDKIVRSIHELDGFIRSMSSATQEQSGGVQQVNSAVTELDEVTQRNAALLEQSSSAASDLRTQAADLASTVGRFRLAA